jgi:hypothetical protein
LKAAATKAEVMRLRVLSRFPGSQTVRGKAFIKERSMSSTTHAMDGRKEQERKAPLPRFQGEDQDMLIAELTLRKWERAGMPRGQWEIFWIEAEQELLAVPSEKHSPGW